MNKAQRKIMQYLNRSAGNCNHVSEHTLRCFLGMIETGEATIDDMKKCGGEYLLNGIRDVAKELNLTVPGEN